jgi:uncharacterized cupredoxin-like copper-binding protein
MMKSLILALCVAAAGCATTVAVGPSPEAQIATGAQTVTAATTLATVALRDQKITVTTAKSYRNMLAAAGESLKDANTDLEACRKDTGSTAATKPDPCWPKVQDVVTIALQNIAGVRAALAVK